jgi:hypothetical protein
LAPTAFVDIPIPDVTDADWFSYFGGGYGGGSDAGFGGASAYAPGGVGGSYVDPQGGPHDKRVVPLMMSDDFIALSTLFFSFLVLRCQRGRRK